MNHGNSAQLSGDFRRATYAYDRTIQLLDLSSQTNESVERRAMLGAAWLNQGHARLALGEFSASRAALERSIEIFRVLPMDDSPWYRVNSAAAWMNLANLELAEKKSGSSFSAARQAARESVALIEPVEKTSISGAEVSLKARRAWCSALGEFLVGPAPSAPLLSETADVAEAALVFAFSIRLADIPDGISVAVRLFYFTAELYRRYQVHFLAEFIGEQIARVQRAAPELRENFESVAREVLARANADLSGPRRLVWGDAAAARELETWRELRDLAGSLEPT